MIHYNQRLLEFVLTSVLECEAHANKYSNHPCPRSQIYRRTEAKVRTNIHTYINRVTSLCRLLRLHQWKKTSLWRLLSRRSLYLVNPPRDKQRTWAREAGPGKARGTRTYMFHRKKKLHPAPAINGRWYLGLTGLNAVKNSFFFFFKRDQQLNLYAKIYF